MWTCLKKKKRTDLYSFRKKDLNSKLKKELRMFFFDYFFICICIQIYKNCLFILFSCSSNEAVGGNLLLSQPLVLFSFKCDLHVFLHAPTVLLIYPKPTVESMFYFQIIWSLFVLDSMHEWGNVKDIRAKLPGIDHLFPRCRQVRSNPI